MPSQPMITPSSWAMVAVLGVVWGSTFLVIELALEGITPFWLDAARISFALVLTMGVWGWRGWPVFLTSQRDWATLGFVGVISAAVPFVLLSWGQQYVTSGFAGVSMAAVALIVLPMAHFLVPGERMGPKRFFGFVIGFVGVVVLIGESAFISTGASLEPYGRLACVGAAACYATSSVLMRRLPPLDPIGLAAMPLVFGTILVVPLAWIVEGPPPLPSGQTIAILAFLGLVPTAGANLLRVLVIRSAGPVFMSLTNYQVPLWSVVLGVLILGEPWQWSLLLAMALILAGVGLSQWTALSGMFGRKG